MGIPTAILGREPPSEPSTKRKLFTTLMSAFTSSRPMNSWLYFKRVFQAVPGRAGGAVVMTTVDHPLMRGLEPHDPLMRRGAASV